MFSVVCLIFLLHLSVFLCLNCYVLGHVFDVLCRVFDILYHVSVFLCLV